MSRRKTIRSALHGARWRMVDEDHATCRAASLPILEAADRGWRRPPGAESAHWRWTRLGTSCDEAFALLGATEIPLALWSAQTRLLRLAEGPYYRVDYLEVDPECRGRWVGAILFLIIAARAAELGARGVVLRSFPEVVPFYEMLGAAREQPPGWSKVEGLVNCCFAGERFVLLLERGDERRDPDSTTEL